MPVTHWLSQLSPSRQALVRLCQSINYGQIQKLHVNAGDPLFHPAPMVLLDVKLDSDEGARPEVNLSDFALCEEVRRLMRRLDELNSGVVERIEVRAGVPRRVLLEALLTESPR